MEYKTYCFECRNTVNNNQYNTQQEMCIDCCKEFETRLLLLKPSTLIEKNNEN